MKVYGKSGMKKQQTNIDDIDEIISKIYIIGLKPSRTELFACCDKIYDIIINQQFDKYSVLLKNITDIQKISNEMIIGLLRTSSLFRDFIPEREWYKFRDLAKIELIKRNKINLLNGIL